MKKMMKKTIFQICMNVLPLLAVLWSGCTTAPKPYANPIIPGFNPDPSICRVGEDYYIVTSTFEYFPGLPIYHSKDLVNWKLIGHALNTPEHLNLDGMKDNKGIYAPTIRYHNGTFYIACTHVDGQGNFIITAKNPAGPWSKPQWIPLDGVDPHLFFDDDGKMYLVGPETKPKNPHSQRHWDIWLQELNPETLELIGKPVTLVSPTPLIEAGVDPIYLTYFEGPRIFKKDGTYYLLVSHGGTQWNHAVSMWKSEKPFGPYTPNPANPIVTHRDLPHEQQKISSVGHADLVQTQKGEWWMSLLGIRPFDDQRDIIGRESFLVPVDWSGDFPIINPGPNQGRVELEHRRPDLPEHPWDKTAPRDDFDAPDLSLEWNFLRTPHTTWWDLTSNPGFLQLELRSEKLIEPVNPSFIGQRQKDMYFEASTRMLFHPEKQGEAAGMTVYRHTHAHFVFLYTLNKGQPILVVRSRSKGGDQIKDTLLGALPVDAEELFLKVVGNNLKYSFFYSLDDKKWIPVKEGADGSILEVFSFTGTQIGLYATGPKSNSTRSASFDWFEYQSKQEL